MSAQLQVNQDEINRRQTPRARTLKHARIIFNHGASVFDCVVRNVSETGALLFVGGPVGIPHKFELAYGVANHGHPCTVRWRTEASLGVSFDDAAGHAA